jgi:flagellin FlaB
VIIAKVQKNILHSCIHYTNTEASVGIGGMIVFIAIILVSGIAASVLIQMSTHLESQAMTTGQETTAEVSTGLAVLNIDGRVENQNIIKMVIKIGIRAGSQDVDLSRTVLEIADTDKKYILSYDSGNYQSSPSVVNGIFGTDAFSLTADDFGVIVLKDSDSSCQENNPSLTPGDKVVLTINCTSTMNNINCRTDIWGALLPHDGIRCLFEFRTPPIYNDKIHILY